MVTHVSRLSVYSVLSLGTSEFLRSANEQMTSDTAECFKILQHYGWCNSCHVGPVTKQLSNILPFTLGEV